MTAIAFKATKLWFSTFGKMLLNEKHFTPSMSQAVFQKSHPTFFYESDTEDYPNFYYFENVKGKNYVLQQEGVNSIDSIIYEIDSDIGNQDPCQVVIEQVTQYWRGDQQNHLRHYGLA